MSTEQERAEFDAWYAGVIQGPIKRLDFEAVAQLDCLKTAYWFAWQAARRAPVAPMERLRVNPAAEPAAKYVYGDKDALLDVVALSNALEQVKQRLSAAPVVPQFSRVAQTKLDYLLEAGEVITGYAIENKDGRRGAINCHGFVYWWQDAAAPQPPETDHIPDAGKMVAAPVQLPEPVLYVSPGQLANHTDIEYPDSGRYIPARKTQAGNFTCGLLTEQQVRQHVSALEFQLDELAMLTRKLVQSLRKAAPGNESAEKALDYLKRKGLAGHPLRGHQE